MLLVVLESLAIIIVQKDNLTSKALHVVAAILVFALPCTAENAVDQYNAVWNSPSKDSSGSMPLGNGDIGLNVWVEEGGDLVFYIGKTDAWSESARLLKLGRVRVRFSPNPFGVGQPFRQTLKLSTGEILIAGGKPGAEMKLRIWVDANQPVIRVESDAAQNTEMQVIYERWRDQQRRLEGQELSSAYGLDQSPDPVLADGDTIQQDAEDRVVWYHRNTRSSWPAILKLQGMLEAAPAYGDPLLHRTFGAAMEGSGFTKINQTTLRSTAPRKQQSVSIYALTMTADPIDQWLQELGRLIARVDAMKTGERRAAHEKWWQDFWNRSWVRVSGGTDQKTVSSGYALQRFLNACGGRGAQPIKFNGSIFTVDAKEKDNSYDADYRRWGGPYWFQNTRLIYWPMLAAGDYDLMEPFFRMYTSNRMLAERRTRLYFHHDGLFFPETMYFFGAYANSNYGLKRDGRPLSYVENPYIRNYFSGGLELASILLEYYQHTQDKRFLHDAVLPIAESVITFYDKHYERGPDGKIRFNPAQSLETWHEALNPLPEIAGLRSVLNELLIQKLPLNRATANMAKRMQQQVPALPVKQVSGKSVLQPADQVFGEIRNSENPELYAVFPYRLYGVNKPDLEVGRATFEARRFKKTGGWTQDAIQAAFLGLTNSAKRLTIENFSVPTTGSRFPAFWGPNYDWTPDQDHGSVASMALQTMLMQTDGTKIVLFPSWPKDWDVEFRLHAPLNTTVEGVFKAGKLERLTVTPEKRSADVIRMNPE